MTKGAIAEGIIERVEFPNKGILTVDGERLVVKNTIPGQTVRVLVTKRRKGKSEGRVVEVLKKAPQEKEEGVCPHFTRCGGCIYQSLPYEEQLNIKEGQIKELLFSVYPEGSFLWQGLKPSPLPDRYRNKMEFSFGDEVKGGDLALGMHGLPDRPPGFLPDSGNNAYVFSAQECAVLPEASAHRLPAPSFRAPCGKNRGNPGGSGNDDTDWMDGRG